MNELKIPEIILRERQKRNMTQDELAQALGVSSQAVSNWERGGYPDITLLPKIAGFFGITVDELIGTDEATRDSDLMGFFEKWKSTGDDSEKLRLAHEMYNKYPNDLYVIEEICALLIRKKQYWKKERVFLRNMCEKILRESTHERSRINAIEFLSVTATDEEWEENKLLSSEFYSAQMYELNEERLWGYDRTDEFNSQNDANNVLILQHFLSRESMRYFDNGNSILFEYPDKTAALMKYRMRLIEAITDDGEIPEAWLGYYGELCLKAAGSLIAAEKKDEGFSYLDRAFDIFENWIKIPNGKRLSTGPAELFGGAEVNKNSTDYMVHVYMPDGTSHWTPYLWMTWQSHKDIEMAMSKWPWFDSVRDDARFIKRYARAKKMAGEE